MHEVVKFHLLNLLLCCRMHRGLQYPAGAPRMQGFLRSSQALRTRQQLVRIQAQYSASTSAYTQRVAQPTVYEGQASHAGYSSSPPQDQPLQGGQHPCPEQHSPVAGSQHRPRHRAMMPCLLGAMQDIMVQLLPRKLSLRLQAWTRCQSAHGMPTMSTRCASCTAVEPRSESARHLYAAAGQACTSKTVDGMPERHVHAERTRCCCGRRCA